MHALPSRPPPMGSNYLSSVEAAYIFNLVGLNSRPLADVMSSSTATDVSTFVPGNPLPALCTRGPA